ncbi:MAG: vgr related protein [Sphingomonas sp. 28-62-20]|uniref:vgr related protein n=1 Tax=Sphingomonas sp. 28-62-20 TaxID=1970433 RepID=UPI000BCD3D49|nr:MAG: vgr related protein [Sphingomonas sp. 28-62-20]
MSAAGRSLTSDEVALARTIFGAEIEYGRVQIIKRKWAFFQPRETVMAPRGNIHFHPEGCRYCADFALAEREAQGLFIHEMTHVWQHQQGIFLPLRRLPFARYDYRISADKPFARYGIEQQAEIVRHAFLLRLGVRLEERPPLARYEQLLPFR